MRVEKSSDGSSLRVISTTAAVIAGLVVAGDIAEAAGMERLVVLQLLSEGADKEAVAREHAMAVQGGVTGVPFAIFAGKVAVVGAETPERIAEAIDQALAA